MKEKCVVILLVLLAVSLLDIKTCTALIDDSDTGIDSDMLTSSTGEVAENVGGGEFVSGSGDITQTESMGEGEYRTSSGDILLNTGAGEYIDSDSETLRGMDD